VELLLVRPGVLEEMVVQAEEEVQMVLNQVDVETHPLLEHLLEVLKEIMEVKV
jgi:hypothetical protein|tara:strand:+ start:719 stop:877 length:159 start_codon:yes stop_codon:yes gene_type:complete